MDEEHEIICPGPESSSAEWDDLLSSGTTLDDSEAEAALAPLDRFRPVRDRIVPVWAIVVSGILLVALASISIIFALVAASSTVTVPGLVGSDIDQARVELKRIGLDVEVESRQFSELPPGQILSQDPGEGGTLRKGESVQVVVSAGTDEFVLPDVTGMGLMVARGTLEDHGLVVRVQSVISDEPSGTVLASMPAAGTTVRAGDSVRLQVSASHAETVTLRPYVLDGVTVTIDAAPSEEGSGDPTMEVARRLRSLLEASGATVVMLRSSTDTATTDADRAKRLLESPSTLSVGLSVRDSGTSSKRITYPDTSTVGPAGADSLTLATTVASNLTPVTSQIAVSSVTSDPVLWGSGRPWLRLYLGSISVREDRALFSDPQWADSVARAVYAAIGSRFGQGSTP